MSTIAKTKENNAKVKALKKIAETKWTGTTVHSNLHSCLTALNLYSNNSGWFEPKACKIKGLTGIFMINPNGSIFCEARIIKESENEFRIEYMTTSGWNEFEKLYINLIEEKIMKKTEIPNVKTSSRSKTKSKVTKKTKTESKVTKKTKTRLSSGKAKANPRSKNNYVLFAYGYDHGEKKVKQFSARTHNEAMQKGIELFVAYLSKSLGKGVTISTSNFRTRQVKALSSVGSYKPKNIILIERELFNVWGILFEI